MTDRSRLPTEPGVPLLETARFTMRPLERGDAAALLPTLGHEAQCRYLTRAAFGSEEELWGWLADPAWPGLTWIAVDADEEVVGRFVAVPVEEEGVFDLGYIVCAHRQGEGIAVECSEALLRHLFVDSKARKVVAEVDIENVVSIRTLERLGFTREAFHPAYEETHKSVCDVAIYGLDRSAFASEPG